MKNKNIWFVIMGILAVGILVTVSNSFYLKRQANIPELAAAYESTLANPVVDAATEEVLKSAQESGQAFAGGTTSQETETAHQVISPLETAATIEAEVEASLSPDQGNVNSIMEITMNYENRLDELDLQIQRIRSEETESTTYSMKTAAENELRLWDSELNTIYNDILTHLDEEQTKQLVAEEREWMKIRDDLAVEAAKKSAGGTLEGLEYTASLAISTRQRAYDLAECYEQVAQ